MASSAAAEPKAPVLSYEGQPVSSLELAGQPDADLTSLRPLIAQPTGAPYSQQKIEQTVANLERTGRFRSVQTDVTPEAGGLHVMFVLQPAIYFGVFQFPGALERFSYPRLLQAANYPRQEPYTSGRVQEAASHLLQLYRANGYFLAMVNPQLQTDTGHGIVNVVFSTRLNRHATFGTIQLTGASPAETKELEHKLHSFMARIRGAYLKTGKSYSPKRLEAAKRYLQGQLGKQHYLAAEVEMLPPKYDPETNRADITFRVTKGREIAIKINGAHVWGRTEKKLIPMYQENAVDPDLVREGSDNLTSYFQSKGFFDAKVTSRTQPNAGGTTVYYDVQKGRRGKVTGIEFQGDTQGQDPGSHVTVERARWWLPFFSRGKYSEHLAHASVKQVEGAYRAAGFSHAKVTVQAARKEGDVRVVFRIDAGPRDIVEALEVQGNKSISQAQLGPLNLEPGKPFSQNLLNKDRDRILTMYLDHGFLNAVFRAKATPEKNNPQRVQVTYTITEGPQVHTSTVLPVGARYTRTDTIQTNANIRAGKPLSESALLQSESQLLDLPEVFDWTSVDTREPITDQSQADVLIKVHESKRNTIAYGFGFEVTNRGGVIPSGTVALPGLPPVGLPSNFETSQKTFWGPRGSIEYTRSNLFGRAQSFTVNAFAGRLDQRASTNWLSPSFLNSSWTGTATFSVERSSQNPLFTSAQGQASLQFQRYLDAKKAKTLTLRYSFTRTNLSNLLVPGLVLPQDQNVRLSTLAATYARDTRDNILDAHRGMYQSLEVDLNPSFLGSNFSYARLLHQTSYFKPVFGKNTIWANSVRLGFEQAFPGSSVPTSEAFFSGGGSTLRGFPLNGAGPQRPVTVCGNPTDLATCGLISVPVGGRALVVLNSELRFPLGITKNLGGVVFYDGGNVFTGVGVSSIALQYSNSVGGGLRYATPVGPIRIDIGHLVNTVPGVKSTQIFITLGQAF